MPPVAESFSLGAPVEIGRIQKELKKLWSQSEGVKTRASLINLAVYSDAPGSLSRNTELISRLTEDHACRAIVIQADSDTQENNAEAWISAHCHVGRAGSRQICSEQISFRLGGPVNDLLPNIVFSHLDSDLPFYLWWQAPFRPPIDPLLWSWVDHLIYDSQTWDDFKAQLDLVDQARNEADQRIVLCDLNWTRLDKIRVATAQFFDPPAAHHHFDTIDHVEVSHAPGYQSTAVLLVCWLAAQLKWRIPGDRKPGSSLRFTNRVDRQVVVELHDTAGEPISSLALRSGAVEFGVKHPTGADLLEVTRHDSNECRLDQLMPAPANDVVGLVSEQLMRGGPHNIYLRVLDLVRQLI